MQPNRWHIGGGGRAAGNPSARLETSFFWRPLKSRGILLAELRVDTGREELLRCLVANQMQRKDFPGWVVEQRECGNLVRDHPGHARDVGGVQAASRGEVVDAEGNQQ